MVPGERDDGFQRTDLPHRKPGEAKPRFATDEADLMPDRVYRQDVETGREPILPIPPHPFVSIEPNGKTIGTLWERSAWASPRD
jgi:hypothetical protein